MAATAPEIVIEDHEGDKWLNSIKEKGGDASTNAQLTRRPKIQKVPQMLREIKSGKKCYDPAVVCIGPYHHHRKSEFHEVESLKMTMAFEFVEDSKKPIEVLYKKVIDVCGNARKCYAENSTDDYDDEAFARMMFLDGCFVLHFILCLLENTRLLKMKMHVIAFVTRDLLLLENQLPYLVLEALMSLRFDRINKGKELIEEFIKLVRNLPSPHDSWLTRALRVFRRPKVNQETREDHEHLHLLECFHTHFTEKKKNEPLNKSQGRSSYRSAKELNGVGIHFRPSKSDQFTDVTFSSSSLAGLLRLPRISVDDSTKALLLNLVAYETCPDAGDELEITSYICFMDALIDHPEDVKELRSKGILFNFLGSDQKVANLFNKISKNLAPNPAVYSDVKSKLESHYRSLMKRWIAEWLHNHFDSPWTLLAFAAAVFALFLSAVQTYKTVFPGSAAPPVCGCGAQPPPKI